MDFNAKCEAAKAVARRVWSEKIGKAHHRVNFVGDLPEEIKDHDAFVAYAEEFERIRKELRQAVKGL